MMCPVTWFSVIPGRKNLIVSQCAASPMAPTMRRHSCSSVFFTARASIIGVMPSVQWIFASWNIWIMLMSTKSTPSFCPATPWRFISSTIALVNFLTCACDAGPAAPLIQAYDQRTFSGGIQGEWRWICAPMSPCSNNTGAPSPHKSA